MLRKYIGIISAVNQLRNPVDQMLGPNQLSIHSVISIHEIVERACGLVKAETSGIQLIQTMLNVVRNAVQALGQQSVITLCVSKSSASTPSSAKRYKSVAR